MSDRVLETSRQVYRVGTACVAITEAVAARLSQAALADTRLCGACGCLCRADEACPKCRADLFDQPLPGVTR